MNSKSSDSVTALDALGRFFPLSYRGWRELQQPFVASGKAAPRGISFQVKLGEPVSLLGTNCAGKSASRADVVRIISSTFLDAGAFLHVAAHQSYRDPLALLVE